MNFLQKQKVEPVKWVFLSLLIAAGRPSGTDQAGAKRTTDMAAQRRDIGSDKNKSGCYCCW